MDSKSEQLSLPVILQSKVEKPANYSKYSDAVINALHHVKEFMTDSQKAHTMLKEGKILMEQGNFQGAIGIVFIVFIDKFVNCYVSNGLYHRMLQ